MDYAIWAVYRAAQAGSSKAKGVEFSDALRQCGIIEYIDNYDIHAGTDSDAFKVLHNDWCDSVINHVMKKYKKTTYGIAAKLISIFLKYYFILAGNENTSLVKVIHSLIDSYLLKSVDSATETKLDKDYKWEKPNKEKYFELLKILNSKLKPNEEFWRIEKYWKLG